MPEIILPGTYVTVRDEALISAGRVVTGNIGIVGTASKGPVNSVKIIGSFSEARELFGDSDPWKDGSSNELTLIRALEQIYNNGGRTVYAVRTANGTPVAAAYQTVNGGDNLTKLTANSPGTWGGTIQINISNADDNALVTDELAIVDVNAIVLNRSNIVSNGLNSIVLHQASTGQTRSYTIVYDTTPDNNEPEVGLDTTTGALTFTTLGTHAPTTNDTITARYAVPDTSSRKVELYYQASKETYIIADASHLAEQVNQSSGLVQAAPADETAFYNELPDTTGGEKMLFGTGLNGHDAGSNGAAAIGSDYQTSLAFLENELINIVMLAGQDDTKSDMVTTLLGHINTTAEIKRERIAVIGSAGPDNLDSIAGHSLNGDRIIFVAPGLKTATATLPGAYTAAAVVGLISASPVQTSPTNKVLNIPGLSSEYSASKLEKLVLNRVLAVEKREGYRIVKGITTATNSAWHQITTRRIVDFAIYGVRSGCNPYIGKLNNERVRGAMKATLDAFLTRMVEDEALISYELEVTATRAQQIEGVAVVTMVIRPTFSIDFIKVTMYLE